MALKDVKKVKNVSWPVVGSVMAGIALFGFAAWGIKRLPSNYRAGQACGQHRFPFVIFPVNKF